jgi:GNAT superfamily N-acetyltransferase
MPDKEVIIHAPAFGLASICEVILRSLPGWFGIEEAIVEYLKRIEVLPTLLATYRDLPVGFLSFERFGTYSAEMIVLGILPDWHRKGIGRALFKRAETILREQGIEFVQLKTLSDSHPDPGYAKTRAFYLALGYRPLQEFPLLWGPHSPCLQMIKRL